MKKENGRTCLCCRKCKSKDELFRFVVINGQLSLSPSLGRGTYLCKQDGCIEKAFTKGLIEKKGKIANKEEEMKKLQSALTPSLSFLGILNRGGKTLIGSALGKKANKLPLLLLANDASENTKKEYASCHVVSAYSKSELGASLGYEEISALGITDAKAAKAFLEKAKAEGRDI